jgi:ribosomal protein L37AE/L43A
VEKQLHAALGAKHKAGINGSTEPYRIPSMHSLHNYVEGVRRRVKNLEDLEGASECVAVINQLKVNRTAGGIGRLTQPIARMTTKTTTAPTTTLDTIVEEIMETEEEILARQVALSDPNKAKQLAKTIIKETN